MKVSLGPGTVVRWSVVWGTWQALSGCVSVVRFCLRALQSPVHNSVLCIIVSLVNMWCGPASVPVSSGSNTEYYKCST
ncbi:hypothetical protein E2C01_039640 [Portunus trituberculatus]|uniref:Uncharacterized protein n=1 Tax=Portunus trituberculatus TaxID=210409 RepID=A0A5B7FNJ3_PORTR|nr:hypothetical protein [Portunus trituberculatus]